MPTTGPGVPLSGVRVNPPPHPSDRFVNARVQYVPQARPADAPPIKPPPPSRAPIPGYQPSATALNIIEVNREFERRMELIRQRRKNVALRAEYRKRLREMRRSVRPGLAPRRDLW